MGTDYNISLCYRSEENPEWSKDQDWFLRNWLSYVGRRADALALRADERRDKLRKAAGRGKYFMIRRYLNGAT